MTYPTVVIDRVIDGDTLWVKVRVRLRKSSPDSGTAGAAATKRAQASYRPGKRHLLKAYAVDEYGRIVGELSPVLVR